MYLGTHACMPVLVVSAIDIVRLITGKTKILNNRQLVFIGLAGILPDVLWPHFSMQQRLNSWTHTVWFLIILAPVVFILAKWKIKQNYLKFSVIFWLAVSLHLLMDALSGGIKFFFPFGDRIGDYYIAHPHWKIWELVFVGSTSILIFVRYSVKRYLHKKNNTGQQTVN